MINPKPGVEIETATTHVPQMADLPVPKGFRLAEDRLQSYVVEAGQFRTGRQEYFGTARVLDVVQYLEERYPQHGWVLQSRSTPSDSHAFMIWRKADCTVKVDVESVGSDATRILIKIGTSRDEHYIP